MMAYPLWPGPDGFATTMPIALLAHRLHFFCPHITLRVRGARDADWTDMQASSLELVQLTKMFGSTTAVDAINLRIPAGSYCCLLGPSGCGKTSTCA